VFGEERLLVEEVFSSNWIAPLGPQVDAFEREFGEAVEVPNSLALSSGTAALHLAMRLLGVGPGDHVVCSSLTFCASANAIVYERGAPVFVDCDSTWTLDPNLLEDAIKTSVASGVLPKAVIAVDLYGQCADYETVLSICNRHGVPLVEDAAEALGSTYRGRQAGGFGLLGVFSFNGNKIITTSGGGMLVSHEPSLVQEARHLATQARDSARHYEHSTIGYNYRLSNVLAAIGRGQLKSLEQRVAARRAVFARYARGLEAVRGLAFMPEPAGCRSNRWLTCLTIDPHEFGATREDVRLALEAENIESRPTWKPMHLQPVFSGCRVHGGAVSEHIFENGLCLPSGSSLSESDQERIISIVRDTAW
jgi:dTDP-4-amino-4,6-dideoxygalactose transaminase